MRIASATRIVNQGYPELHIVFSDLSEDGVITVEAARELNGRGWDAVHIGIDSLPEVSVGHPDGGTLKVSGFTDDVEVVKLARAFVQGLPVGKVDLDALGVAHD